MILWAWSRTVSLLIFSILVIPSVSWSQGKAEPKLIEGAKKEGQIVYYTTMTLDQSKQTVDRFEKKYPFIKVTLFRTGGGPLLNKIFTESRGGRHDWDVVVGRGEMALPMMQRKLLASYPSPESKMIDEQLVDKEGFWTAYYVNSYVLGWNTKLVKREDVQNPSLSPTARQSSCFPVKDRKPGAFFASSAAPFPLCPRPRPSHASRREIL